MWTCPSLVIILIGNYSSTQIKFQHLHIACPNALGNDAKKSFSSLHLAAAIITTVQLQLRWLNSSAKLFECVSGIPGKRAWEEGVCICRLTCMPKRRAGKYCKSHSSPPLETHSTNLNNKCADWFWPHECMCGKNWILNMLCFGKEYSNVCLSTHIGDREISKYLGLIYFHVLEGTSFTYILHLLEPSKTGVVGLYCCQNPCI